MPSFSTCLALDCVILRLELKYSVEEMHRSILTSHLMSLGFDSSSSSQSKHSHRNPCFKFNCGKVSASSALVSLMLRLSRRGQYYFLKLLRLTKGL